MRMIYISQGNIPSKWAHTFQAMKMAEALMKEVDSFTLLTGGGLFPPRRSPIDPYEWYGIRSHFPLVYLPVHWRMKEPLFSEYRYPRFDRLAALYARLLSPDLVFTRSPHAGLLTAQLKLETIIETHMETYHPEFKRILQAAAYTSLRGLVTVHEFLKTSYVKAGFPEAKIYVFPDGVNLEAFDSAMAPKMLRSHLGLIEERPLAMYCGHLYPEKGAKFLIDAARYLPDTNFCVVGGWPEHIEQFKQEAQGVPNIRLTGFVPNNLIPKYLMAADILLLPNSNAHHHAFGTSPLKLFEYMAANRPIVASRIPAFISILAHKRNAYLVEPDSGRAIAEGIRAVLGDSELSQRITTQARADVKAFTWKRRARDILKYFGFREQKGL